jgi:capsid protein
VNAIDQVISWFSPRYALQRARARAALGMLQRFGYEGAKTGRRTGGWHTSGSDANSELGPSINSLRDRARDLVRNNPYAAKALSDLVGNQIGTGIAPRANTGNPKTDSIIDEVFAEWSNQCDADGQLDFFGIQWQVARAVAESGESLVRFRPRRESDGLTVPVQLQVL